MAALSDVRDALLGIEWAFDEAARRRVNLVRRLGAVKPPAALATDHQALVEALLRREAADRNATTTPAERLEQIAEAARAVRDARARLERTDGDGDAAEKHRRAVTEFVSSLDATWAWALTEAQRRVVVLRKQAPDDVATAVEDYVGALSAAHRLGPHPRAEDVARTGRELEAAHERLEQTLAALSG